MDGYMILHGSLKVRNTVATLPPLARNLPKNGVIPLLEWLEAKRSIFLSGLIGMPYCIS